MKTLINKKVFLAISIIFPLIISGCSTKPSERDAKKVFENLLENQTKGKVKLVDFKNLNAEEGEFLGVKIYAVEFNSEIEFLEECYYRTRDKFLDGQVPGIVIDKPVNFGFGEINMFGLKKAEPGMKEELNGVLLFEKNEKGWKGMDGNVY